MIVRYQTYHWSATPRLTPFVGCDVWGIAFDDCLLTLDESCERLSVEECERVARYRIDKPKRQFAICRAALRGILADYLRIAPHEVRFQIGANGKPILAGDSAIHFNVTHSGNFALVAIAPRRVGIDIEVLREVSNMDGLVERFFGHEEKETYRNLVEPQRSRGFFRAWTCKEALMKAVGTGLQHVDRCVVELDPTRPPRAIRFDELPEVPLKWSLATWEPHPGYLAAIAMETETPITINETSGPEGPLDAILPFPND